jgi:hypothetical protein
LNFFQKLLNLIKRIKFVLAFLFLLIVSYFIYSKIELTKVVLQCVFLTSNSQEITDYYKITKKLFIDEPYKIYSTDVEFMNGKYSSRLQGYWNQSEEVELASEYPTFQKDISKYDYPNWYTFFLLTKEKNNLYRKGFVSIFINRETLELEKHFWDTPEKYQCKISNEKHFDERFESDKNSKLKNKKI